MSEVIVVGPDDHGLTEGFVAAGVDAVHLEGHPVGDDLDAAGIANAGALVLTHTGLATLVSVAKERNKRLTAVFYAESSLPAFASRQADLAVDPALVDTDALVEAVVDRLASAP